MEAPKNPQKNRPSWPDPDPVEYGPNRAEREYADRQAAATPQKKRPLERLVVWAAPVKNTRILVAYKPATDPRDPTNLVTVNVADNQNFLPKMVLHVREVNPHLYDLVGALPRWRGKW